MKLVVLSALLSLIGCTPKAAAPEKPGLSFAMRYPLLLIGDRNLKVADDEAGIISTTGASGLNFLAVKILDSEGNLYSVEKVTPFGKKSFALDMGTTQYQVFLSLKREVQIDLKRAKALAMEVVVEPHGLLMDSEQGIRIATKKIADCKSLAELIQECRKTSEWR